MQKCQRATSDLVVLRRVSCDNFSHTDGNVVRFFEKHIYPFMLRHMGGFFFD